MKLRCPECGSTNIDQYRMLTGAVWCIDCYFTASKKEEYNPFIVDKEDTEILYKFYEEMEKNSVDIPDDFKKVVNKHF